MGLLRLGQVVDPCYSINLKIIKKNIICIINQF
jgi:hypothetical protein